MKSQTSNSKPQITLLLILAAAGFLWAGGEQSERLLDLRRDLHLTQADPLDNAPPLVAFTTVAMGGFRGLAADLLWLRSTRLQEEGRYFELVQLADWITKLEPRFTSVWAYHAWNLAYNISVLFNDPRDRWRWVRNGMQLLRDEGLAYNPGEPRLLYELGWIFHHKIGGDSDQAHAFYKRAWAAEMAELFDGPAPDFMFCAANPGDPKVRRLRDVYKLDPALMQRIDEETGPLDWRLPQAHAIYWATRSRALAEGFDAQAADRMIFQALADAFRRGSLYIDKANNRFLPTPNIDLVPRVDAGYLKTIKAFPADETLKTAHANFLREAVVTLFSYNRMREAQERFQELADSYPSEETAAGFDAFVFNIVTAQTKDLSEREARAFVDGALYQSAFWQLLGESDRAQGFAIRAKLIWSRYMESLASAEHAERVGLPPLDELQKLAIDKARGDLGM